jgi:hypothetical protein
MHQQIPKRLNCFFLPLEGNVMILQFFARIGNPDQFLKHLKNLIKKKFAFRRKTSNLKVDFSHFTFFHPKKKRRRQILCVFAKQKTIN